MPRERSGAGFEAKIAERRDEMVSRYADVDTLPTLERVWKMGSLIDSTEDMRREKEIVVEPSIAVEQRFLADILPKYISPDAKGSIQPIYNARYSYPAGERVVIGIPDGMRFAIRPNINRDRSRDGFESFIRRNKDDYRHLMQHEYSIDPITLEQDVGVFTPHSAISLRPEQIQDLAATGLGEREPSLETVRNALEQISKSLALQVKYLELSGESHDEAFLAWQAVNDALERVKAGHAVA